MKPLIVLISVFIIGVLLKNVTRSKKIGTRQIGRISMSAMLLFTGVAHFVFAEGMVAMLPDFIPFKMAVVNATGILEFAGAIGLLVPKLIKVSAKGLILFLIMVLPANIYAAIHAIDPVSGSADGPGLDYLFFRIPLQLFFIGWIYFSALQANNNTQKS